MSFATYSQGQILHCYTYGLLYAGRGIAVPRNSLARCNGRHLRIRRLVQFILADPVYYNALTNCATRVCCACVDLITCVAVRYLTLRTGCERHGRKNLCRTPFRSGHMSVICAGLGSKGKVGVQRGRKTAGCPSFLPTAVGTASSPPRGAARSRRPQTANPPLRFSGKLYARKGRTRLRQFVRPGQPVQKKSRPVRANPPAAVRVPRTIGAEKEPPVRGEPACGSSSAPLSRCRKGAAPSGRTR